MENTQIGVTAVAAAGCGIPRDPESTLDRVRGGTLRAGITASEPWTTLEGGRPGGVEVALVERFAQELGAGAPLVDRAILGLYPTGSTMKTITSVAALEAGVVSPETPISDPGSVQIGNIVFGQTHTHAGADLQGLWGGVPRIPGAFALGLSLDRSALAVRLAVENTPDGTVSIIPFLPNLVSGPPVTGETAAVAPADAGGPDPRLAAIVTEELAKAEPQTNLVREFDFTRNQRLPSLFFVDIQKSQINEVATAIARKSMASARVRMP